MKNSKKFAIISVVVGTVLAVGCLYFVIKQVADGWNDYGDQISAARWGWLILALPLATAGMTMLSLVWRNVIEALGQKASLRDVFVWYQIGNLGKYIPGGVLQILGRSELAVRGGVTRSVAYNSVALSMGATYIAGGLVSAVLLPFVLLERGHIGNTWWVFLVIPIGFAALHPKILGKMFTIAEKAFGGADEKVVPPWITSVKLVARYAPGWVVNGLACWVTALCFDPGAPFLTLVFAGIISWVAGFLVIFVPSGLGVREAAFVLITSASMTSSTAATVAIVSRLVFVLADLIGAFAATLVRKRSKGQANEAALA